MKSNADFGWQTDNGKGRSSAQWREGQERAGEGKMILSQQIMTQETCMISRNQNKCKCKLAKTAMNG
jgi:hypothetical protein